MRTPTTPEGRAQYDSLDALEAAYQAWIVTGTATGQHRRAQSIVRDVMPLLGRALDRVEKERQGRA